MQRFLERAVFVVAIVSAFAGAVVALMPALVLATVTLFYDSAGGVLIFLGSLLNLFPHPVVPGQAVSSLPLFQRLDTDTTFILLRSAVATGLCFVAAVAMVGSWQKQGRRIWLMVGLLGLVAAVAGGGSVALAVMPVIAISVGHCALGGPRRRV